MTMEIEVINKSENYTAKLIVMNHPPQLSNAANDGTEYILKPGESKSLYVYDARSIRVKALFRP